MMLQALSVYELRKDQLLYFHLYVESKKTKQVNKTEKRLTGTEKKLVVARG